MRTRYPQAHWDPIAPWATTGGMTDLKNLKVVWHTTQGWTYPRSTYAATGGIPHFTIDRDGKVYQHYLLNQFSRALLNLPGGVQTNLDGAIQIEIVGFAGKETTRAQRKSIRRLSAWLTAQGVPGRWMNGAPTKRKHDREGQVKLSMTQWDDGSGHCGHSDVPENNHWDPAFVWATVRAVQGGWKQRDAKIKARIDKLRDRVRKIRARIKTLRGKR